MRPFTKEELKVVVVILFSVLAITLINIKVALRRARDAQRRADLGMISQALEAYRRDLGFFPPASENGRIIACRGDNFEEKYKKLVSQNLGFNEFVTLFRPCDWGIDGLFDVTDSTVPAYLDILPGDPRAVDGISYRYLSSYERFQIYTYLEGEESEDQYMPGVVDRSLNCGIKICNYGRSFKETPLDKSIKEYENELREDKLGS